MRKVLPRLPAALWRALRRSWRPSALILAGLAFSTVALLANPSRAPADQDCADAYIRTTQVRSSATVRALFRCLDPALQPISDEDTFVQLAATAVTSPATEVRRLGSQSTASGTVVVYTTVTNGQPVAYAVYLSRTGRIVNVE